jgi:acetylornithine/N-succinyldiaminopimelate aminotransferase
LTTAEIIRQEDALLLPTYAHLPLALVRGEGPWVWDADGRRYLDFYGGHCVTVLGHCPPRVVAALREQAETLLFYSNVVYSPVRAEAARKLVALAPQGLGHPFFCNSGTEANETALKLARTHTGKPGVVAMHGGFHGRTLGSLAVTAGEGYRKPHAAVLPEAHFVPFGNADALAETLAARGDVGAVILEPIQSLAGMNTAPAAYFQTVRDLCDAHGACLIFDEVQTGVGRTGTFSISEQLGVTPDLITLAKSLGSGVPVGAVLVADAIAEAVRPGDHGSTFGGGMLAMRAVSATLDALVEDRLMDRAEHLFGALAEGLEEMGCQVRGRGCLIGVDLGRPTRPVLAALRESGVLAGGSDDPHILRLMPPLNTPAETIPLFLDAMEDALALTADSEREPVAA